MHINYRFRSIHLRSNLNHSRPSPRRIHRNRQRVLRGQPLQQLAERLGIPERRVLHQLLATPALGHDPALRRSQMKRAPIDFSGRAFTVEQGKFLSSIEPMGE